MSTDLSIRRGSTFGMARHSDDIRHGPWWFFALPRLVKGMRGMIRWVCLLVGCWLLAGCGATQPTPLTVRSTASDDTRVSSEVLPDDRVQITIVSPSGIGRSEIAIEGSRLPKRVVLRLHLRGLESLHLTYGGTQVQGFVTSSAPHVIQQQIVVSGSATLAHDLGPDSPFWMPLRLVAADAATPTIPLANGWIEVELPPNFYATNERTFILNWVDFYR